ncbi:DUF4271 domain-containing protein [Aureispira anguillae]|uniref:DUF4271 domain-containing protein n=1 Tax=Aureispira anguillae TaxID=2864201 RepID=A0A915YJ76_9BACT|nr:DUF4271 domain-containing protein [Aureispira anguillae]
MYSTKQFHKKYLTRLGQLHKKQPFYLKLFFVLLFGLGVIHSTSVRAQNIPNTPQQAPVKPNPAPKPLAAPVHLPVSKNKVATTINDISKVSSISYYPKSFKVKESKLSRKYYNNNIFDIDESDNPFALPIGGDKTKRKIKTKNNQGRQFVFAELFMPNDATRSQTTQWLIFVLLGILSFMSILIAIYSRQVAIILKTFLSTSATPNGQREQGSFLKPENFSAYILFVLSMGTFCFLVAQVLSQEVQFNTFGTLLLSIGGIAGIYFLKHLQLKILSYVLPFPQEIEAYSFILSNTNKTLGFILVPLLFLLAHTPSSTQLFVLYFCFILLGLIYIYRTLKGLATAGSIILFHKFHFFVYLCAVEIAPILILLKLLSIL